MDMPATATAEPSEAGQPPYPMGDHDFVLHDHAAHIDDHTGALRAHEEALGKIIDHLSAEPSGPWLWEQLDRAAAEKLWRELYMFVNFLDRRYLRYLGGQGARIVADWYKHPVLVELFTALMVAHRHAYAQSSRVPSFTLVEWHERCLWPTFDRIAQLRLYQGAPDDDAWDFPQGLPLHEHTDRFESYVAEDVATRAEPQRAPASPPEQPSPARAARPTRASAGHVEPGTRPASDDTAGYAEPSDLDAPDADDAPPPPYDAL